MGSGAPPVRTFTLPFHLSDVNLIDAQSQAGMVFDRARLTKIGEEFYNDSEINRYKPQLIEIVDRLISVYPY